MRGATDAVRVVLGRLAPWTGRDAELPTHLRGVPGDYRAERAARLAARMIDPGASGAAPAPEVAVSDPDLRARLRAELATHLRRRQPRPVNRKPQQCRS